MSKSDTFSRGLLGTPLSLEISHLQFPWPGQHLLWLALKLSRTLWGLTWYKSLSVSCFLFAGKRFQPPRPSLSTKGQILTVANQGSKGMQEVRECRKEEQSRNNSASIKAGSWFLLKGYIYIYNNIFEFFCRN